MDHNCWQIISDISLASSSLFTYTSADSIPKKVIMAAVFFLAQNLKGIFFSCTRRQALMKHSKHFIFHFFQNYSYTPNQCTLLWHILSLPIWFISTNCRIWDFCPFRLRTRTEHSHQRPLLSPILSDLQLEGKNKVKSLKTHQYDQFTYRKKKQNIFLLTSEVEDFRPLLADVDTDVRTSHSQIGTALIKHKGLHLKQKTRK